MVEDIDINVNEAPQESESSAASLFEGLRRLTLASIGAADMKREEIEEFVNKLVARGEVAQEDRDRTSCVNYAPAASRGVPRLSKRLNAASSRC